MFTCDANWIRPRNRNLLLAGSPLSLMRVTDVGVDILDALEQGIEPPPGHEPLTDRLILSGSLHREPVRHVTESDITVVIPAYITSVHDVKRLAELVDMLSPIHTIVVDDASPCDFSVERAEIIRQSHNQGPATARNIGARSAKTSVIAFVDSDAQISSQTIYELAQHLHANDADIVAPRVRSLAGRTAVADYEETSSTLDMGDTTTRVRVGARVPYVPSTCLVATAQAIAHLDGFDESLRFGEDVDLVWRAINGGIGVKYVADSEALHRPRRTIAAFARQRFSYGTSAGALARKHGFTASPYRGHVLPTVAWLLTALMLWQIGIPSLVLAVMVSALKLSRKGVDIGTALRVMAQALLRTGNHLANAVTKTWFIPAVIGSVLSTRVAIAVTIAFSVPAILDYVRQRSTNPLTYVVLRITENASYGLGVVWGAIRTHSPTAILPALTFRF